MASNWSSSPDYVGFGQRCVAFVIDALVVFVVVAPLALAVYGREHLFMIFPPLAVLGFWRYCGATPGKLAIAAKIVDAQSGGRPSAARLVARFFAYLVSALPLFLGFVWIAIDRRKQGWHDKIAGTMVIYDDD